MSTISINLKNVNPSFATFHVFSKDLQYSEQIYSLSFSGQCLEFSCLQSQ